MSTFIELTPDQLAEHAFNIFLSQGRHVEGSRVIYRALELDSRHPLAMRCLSDFFAYEGTEAFAAVVLEYALSPACSLSADDYKTLDDLRFLSIWSWGFSRHKSGNPHLNGEAFKQREDFDIDQERYDGFIDSLVSRAGSLELGYQSAITLCGSIAGFLQHSGKPAPDLEDCFRRDHFSITPQYEQWLAESTASLDELKQSVEQMKNGNSVVVEEAAADTAEIKKPWWKVW